MLPAAIRLQNGNSVEEYTPQEDNSASQGGEDAGSDILECTIEIRCDTILDNMENLTAGKESYVPANGCILSTSTVEFEKGETVYDVLSRVCSYAGIQMEASWTPLYNSYYVEGINNLYEFDCGNESGWMYKVNGWLPQTMAVLPTIWRMAIRLSGRIRATASAQTSVAVWADGGQVKTVWKKV